MDFSYQKAVYVTAFFFIMTLSVDVVMWRLVKRESDEVNKMVDVAMTYHYKTAKMLRETVRAMKAKNDEDDSDEMEIEP